MKNTDLLFPRALILNNKTTAEITSMAANAEMGTIFFSSDDSKLIFVKDAAGHEHVTSA